MSLAEAELQCLDFESAVQQRFGKAEVEEARANIAVGGSHMATLKGQYITAVNRIRMQDFCCS